MKFIRSYLNNIDVNYLYILGVTIFLVLPLCSNLMILSDDLIYHTTNIYASDLNLSLRDFIFYPNKVLPFIANNFGYGSGIFYPKLAHNIITFIYQILKHLGISNIIYSIKLFYFILIYLSGMFMYKLVKKIMNNNNVALLSSCLYITFPYFILDIYIRGAMAESCLFIFIPIIFLSIFYLMEKDFYKFYLYFILGYVGAINSHLVLSLYLTIFVMLFLLINYKKIFTKDRFISLVKASLLIMMFVSPFIIPMLEHKFLGEYRVFQQGIMFTKEELCSWLRNLTELFLDVNYVKKCEYTKICYLGVVLSFISVINLRKIVPNEKRKEIISFVVIMVLTFVMITTLFDWSLIPNILYNIQFPWRLRMFTGFCVSIVSGLVLLLFNKNEQKILILIIIILSLGSFVDQIKYENFEYLDSNLLIDSYWGAGVQQEYLPIKAYKDDYYNIRSKNEIIVKDGSATIKIINNRTPYLEFEVIDVDNVVLELPRLYYLGYEIKVSDDNSNKKISYYENEKGFVEVKIKKEGIVTVSYTGTKGYKIGLLMFFIAGIVSIRYLIKIKMKKDV